MANAIDVVRQEIRQAIRNIEAEVDKPYPDWRRIRGNGAAVSSWAESGLAEDIITEGGKLKAAIR